MGMKYEGIDSDHPRIVEAIQTMAKNGKTEGEIQRLVGMPREVVRKHAGDLLKGKGDDQ